ncbi:Basic Proline-rich Protein 1 [Hibiscus trionum]|uniref:Basic Proline-rich Protein 1 n=1 Tax=Hibiscus trionum TaxID=183268 RepID=A0A9W7M478_HIBTR|nr:Basic Proline-rich Protein 1 [Hibiscus trionum]
MNRSFRAQQETAMQTAALKQRQQLRASLMKEKEDGLALFLEMRRREKEQSTLLNHSSEDFDAPLGSKPGTSPIFNLSAPTNTTAARKTGAAADDFLNSESDKNDYEWLLTPPGTPLFTSLEMESQKTVMSQIGAPKAGSTALKSRLANSHPEFAARSNLSPKQPALSPGSNSTGVRRPSSSGGPGSRPGTPTGRPTLTGASKPTRSSTPTSRSTLSSTKSSMSATKPVTSAGKPVTSATKSATKPATYTNKPSVSAAKTASSATKPTVSSRSATPTRSIARSSTPTARPSIPSSKPVSRAATPTRRPSTPANLSATIKPSPSVTMPTPAASRNSVPSRGASPVVKSKPWKPSEMPGFSLDAPPNLRTTLPDRPLSATRGRPGAPSSRSSSAEPGPIGRPRRQSCSPSRGHPPNGAMLHVSGSSVPALRRVYSKVSDNVSPVVMGNKMVERVINMRKLAPPRQDDKHSPHGNLSGKSSSPDSSGFGRTLSKKSLDMAIRHMGINQRIPGNLRPLMTNIPASSMYSVRSGPTRSRNISVSDSPIATSSNASSELSVNNNGICLDGNEVDDISTELVGQSPASMHAR